MVQIINRDNRVDSIPDMNRKSIVPGVERYDPYTNDGNNKIPNAETIEALMEAFSNRTTPVSFEDF